MAVPWQVAPRSRQERLGRARGVLAFEDKLIACGADSSPEEKDGPRRLVRPLLASSLHVRLRVPTVAFGGTCDRSRPCCGPRAERICFGTRTRDPRPRVPRPQRTHGGSVPAAVMAVVAAAGDGTTHPSQAIARRVLALSERYLARSLRRAGGAHGGVRLMRVRGRCVRSAVDASAVHTCSALVRCRVGTDVYRRDVSGP